MCNTWPAGVSESSLLSGNNAVPPGIAAEASPGATGGFCLPLKLRVPPVLVPGAAVCSPPRMPVPPSAARWVLWFLPAARLLPRS